jgi:HPt (histidine-containing phosphotransfer) domain-containing protein
VSGEPSDRTGDVGELLAGVHREFREGLPGRLERIRASLERLREGYDAEAAEIFYRTAHSLKGTAPSFGARALVAPATALAEIGRRWFERGAAEADELRAASEELGRLSSAVERLTAEREDSAAG